MRVRYNMVIDFARPSKSNTVIVAEDDANSRTCHFTLLFDKKPFEMDDVISATVMGRLGDTTVLGEATIVQDEDGNNTNEIEYVIPREVTQNSGTMAMTVSLLSATEEQITSFEFYLNIRNALYNEDDYSSAEDLAGLRDLINRTQTALRRLEDYAAQTSRPNITPIIITVDGVTYEYIGDEGNRTVIDMGNVAYIVGADEDGSGEIGDTVSEAIDATYATAASQSATSAQNSASASEGYLNTIRSEVSAAESYINNAKSNATSEANRAKDEADRAQGYYNSINAIVPTVSMTKDESTGVADISITSMGVTKSVEISDGTWVDSTHTYDADTKKHHIEFLNSRTGTVLSEFDITEPTALGGGDMLSTEYATESASRSVYAARNLKTTTGVLDADTVDGKVNLITDAFDSDDRLKEDYLPVQITQKLSELEDDVDEITEELSHLTWKYHNKTTGKTSLAIPNDANELFIRIGCNGETDWVITTIVPTIALNNSAYGINVGGRGNINYANFSISKTTYALVSAYSNSNDTTGNAVTTIYYR